MTDGESVDPTEFQFVENMIKRREESGYSQADLVKRLRERGWASVHPTTISRIENRDRPVRIGEAARIAEALGAELSDLLPKPSSPLAVFDQVFRMVTERMGVTRAAAVGMATHLVHLTHVLDEHPELLAAMTFPGDKVPTSTTEYLALLGDGFRTAKPMAKIATDAERRALIKRIAALVATGGVSDEDWTDDDDAEA